MKWTFQLSAPRLDLAGAKRDLDHYMQDVVKEAATAWLEAVLREIPVWSGASKATFLKLGGLVDYEIPIFPVAPDRRGIGQAESSGFVSFRAGGRSTYTFTYGTTLSWLMVNEYFDATQWGFKLKKPGPYDFQIKGLRAFLRFAENVRLPSVKPFMKSIRVK